MECIRNIDRSIKYCTAWPKGETLQRLHVRENLRKKAYECSKTESQRERDYPHIGAIMRLLSTLTEPGAFIQGWDVPWRKEHCTLSKKYWIAHRAISLGGTLDWCTLIKRKMTICLYLVENKLFFWGTNGQNTFIKNRSSFSCLIDRIAALHLLYTVVNSINSHIYSFMLSLTKGKKTHLSLSAPSKTNYYETFTDISILYSTKQSSSETQPDIIKDNLFQSVLINIQNPLKYKIKNECWNNKM